MPRSRTKAPLLEAFGGVLQHLHQAHEVQQKRTISHEALARVINKRLEQRIGPLVSVAASTLWRWEAGQVSGPDPLILRELGNLYGVDFQVLLAVLEANLRDVSLTATDGLRLVEQRSSHATKDDNTVTDLDVRQVPHPPPNAREATAQQLLDGEANPAGTYGHADLAATRAAVERILTKLADPLADLGALADDLAGRQAAMDRTQRASLTPRARARRRQPHRARIKKTAR